MNATPQRDKEITLDVALRLYTIRRPLTSKALRRDSDLELLSDCVDDAIDLVTSIKGQNNTPNH